MSISNNTRFALQDGVYCHPYGIDLSSLVVEGGYVDTFRLAKWNVAAFERLIDDIVGYDGKASFDVDTVINQAEISIKLLKQIGLAEEGLIAVGPFCSILDFAGPAVSSKFGFSRLMKRFRFEVLKDSTIHVSIGKQRVAKRNYFVEPHDVYSGYIDNSRHYNYLDMRNIQHPRLLWAGTGGYWQETSVNNIGRIDVKA